MNIRKKLIAFIPALFFVVLVFGMPSIASAADRYWVGDNGTWNIMANWSATSGGAGGESVPTSADNVFFDDAGFSGAVRTVTITAEANCADMTWLTTTGGKTLSLNNDGNQLHIYGSLTLASGMTVTGNTDEILFDAPLGTHSITSNGVSINLDISFNGAAGTWVLQDNLSTTKSIALTAGTLDANGFIVTTPTFTASGTNTRTLDMGSGGWTLNGTGAAWDITDPTGLTLDAGTSTLEVTNSFATAKTFSGGGLTYYNVLFSGDNITVSGDNTFNNFSAYTASQPTGLIFTAGSTQTVSASFTSNGFAGNLAKIQSTVSATPFTLSKSSGTVSVDYMYITDSTAVGGATWYAGANSTSGGGNTGWIFTAPAPVGRYWVGGTGTWDASDTTHWSATPGGASGASVPTNTDNCYFDANSFSGGGQTVTMTAAGYCADMIWTTADAPTLTSSVDLNINGSLELAAGMTVTWSSGAIYFNAVDARTITSNGVTIDAHFYFMTSGTWTLQDNLSVVEYFALVQGTFDANDFDITTGDFYSDYTNTRTLNMGSGTWTLNQIGSQWDISDSTNMTLNPQSSTLTFNATDASQKDFYGGGLSYQNVHFNGRNIVIHDSNVYNDTFAVNNAGLADALFVENGTTQTVTNFVTNGSVGNLAVIQTYTGAPPSFTLSKSSGTVSVDYMSITRSTATGGALWYAGANSTDGTGNTGWIFTVPDTTAPSGTVALSLATVNNSNLDQVLTVTYDEPMDPSSVPAFDFVTDGLFFTSPLGSWTDSTHWTQTFTHDGTAETISGVVITSTDATDVAGNPESASVNGTNNPFDVDVVAPSGGGGGGGYYVAQQPTATPIPTFTPVPPFPQLPTRGDPANLARYGLTEGDTVSSGGDDPDVYIVNEWGYKRLFLNPIIFSFYGHLGFEKVKGISPTGRDDFPISGLFRNCEANDPKVYAVEVTGEDTGLLHHVNVSGDAAVAQDPDFFHKVFCINTNEFNWYMKSPTPYTSLSQIPVYSRPIRVLGY